MSNDNPYSESQFKTLKYCPSFPGTFASLEDARAFCAALVVADNSHHRHAKRALILDAAHARHSNRFRRPPQPPRLPEPA